MNTSFFSLSTVLLLLLSFTATTALAYSPGDTCVLTKIVELRLDPKSSGKKRYLKPGTEVVIIEKFRKRTRVQVSDALGTLGNRPIGKACSWREAAPDPGPEPESIELPPEPPAAPEPDPAQPAPPPIPAAQPSIEEPVASVPVQPAPPVETSAPQKPSPSLPAKAVELNGETSSQPDSSPRPEFTKQSVASPATSHPWVDISLGTTFLTVGTALWLHLENKQQTLTDDALAYNQAETKTDNTWYAINQRQSAIDHHRMVSMTALGIGVVLNSLGIWDLFFSSDSQPSSNSAALDPGSSSLLPSWSLRVRPDHASITMGF